MQNQPLPEPNMTAAKAKIALALSAIGGVLTFVIAYFPDDSDLQTWGGLALGVLTIVATTYGVWKTPNRPTP